ncbi:MAG: hypothetical protein AAF958_04580, partial [Planctomycetota bacterium]
LAAGTTLAVLNPLLDGEPSGPFGWSLKFPIDASIDAADWSKYLMDAGVAWLKYPCWIAPDDTEALDRLSDVLFRTQDDGIITIGSLHDPPESKLGGPLLGVDPVGNAQQSSVAYFRNANQWRPLLEPIMTRLTLKIRHWQIGDDDDFSFLGQANLKQHIAMISRGLQGFGQPLRVTIAWPWLEPTLPIAETSWQAIARRGQPPLTADELDLALEDSRLSQGVNSSVETWLSLQPISGTQYDRDTRITDLVRRMITVRSHRVTAAMISDADQPNSAMMDRDGHPGELFLPFRTASRLLGGMRSIGSLSLPSGISNRVLADEKQAVWVVWSESATEEELYLGEDVRAFDVWGRQQRLDIVSRDGQRRHRVPVGRTPLFVTGVDPMIMRFRMSVRLTDARMDSLMGKRQPLGVTWENPDRSAWLGNVRLTPPAGWQVDAPDIEFESTPGRSYRTAWPIVLTNTAHIGEYLIPMRFDLDTVPPRSFTVHRNIRVGPTGLTINASTRLTANGQLRVIIEMTNLADEKQSYDCLLFPPPGRRYQTRFLSIPAGETVRREFAWDAGADLIGKRMLLRANEQNGGRVVNFPIETVR